MRRVRRATGSVVDTAVTKGDAVDIQVDIHLLVARTDSDSRAPA